MPSIESGIGNSVHHWDKTRWSCGSEEVVSLLHQKILHASYCKVKTKQLEHNFPYQEYLHHEFVPVYCWHPNTLALQMTCKQGDEVMVYLYINKIIRPFGITPSAHVFTPGTWTFWILTVELNAINTKISITFALFGDVSSMCPFWMFDWQMVLHYISKSVRI